MNPFIPSFPLSKLNILQENELSSVPTQTIPRESDRQELSFEYTFRSCLADQDFAFGNETKSFLEL